MKNKTILSNSNITYRFEIEIKLKSIFKAIKIKNTGKQNYVNRKTN